jgi:pyruvate/2-oxoglutarate dehydrogenase complex dihydrolipoamide dehydrogenase (E3) component
MPEPERFEVLILGSGTGGKLVAWHLAQSGHRTAVVGCQPDPSGSQILRLDWRF